MLIFIAPWSNGAYAYDPDTNAAVTLKTILPVPYYDQGVSGYCWASCLAMLINYHKNPEDFIKPWTVVDHFALGRNGGLYLSFHLTEVKEFLFNQTGVIPEIQTFNYFKRAELKKYLTDQILINHEPVFLGFEGIGSAKHVIIVAGYEKTDAEEIFYVHNPDLGIVYDKKTWQEIDSDSGWFKRNWAIAIPGANTHYSSKAITINLLPPEIILQTLCFKSPIEDHFPPAGPKPGINFNWYDETTKKYGFMSNNGDNGMTVEQIPNYYSMQLNVQVVNADTQEGNDDVVLKYVLMQKSNRDIFQYETQSFTLSAGLTRTIQFTQNNLRIFDGDCELQVIISNQDNTEIYDQFKIDIAFDQGIQLTVAEQHMISTDDKKIASLSWNDISGDFSQYVVYKRTDSAEYWTMIAAVPRAVNEYKDILYDPEKETYYSVAAINPPLKNLIASNEVSAGIARIIGVWSVIKYRDSFGKEQTGTLTIKPDRTYSMQLSEEQYAGHWQVDDIMGMTELVLYVGNKIKLNGFLNSTYDVIQNEYMWSGEIVYWMAVLNK
jgi:hypothetical protein